MANEDWVANITKLDSGIFRTMNGNADEMIAVGRMIKAGFACSRVDVTNARYDAIVDLGDSKRKLLRVQVKGTSHGSVSFIGGTRSGQQIDKSVASRGYKYTKDDCDLILAIDSRNGDCYIIPVCDIQPWGKTKALSKLSEYKEQWAILLKIANSSSNPQQP